MSTKIGGLSWVLFGLMGIWAFAQSERHLQLHAPSQPTTGLPSPHFSGPTAIEEAARIWLFACLAATAIRIIPHAFWQDDWDRRHAEMRLVLGAMAATAWVSHFPRHWVGLGAVLFAVSDLLIFARMGPLAGSMLPQVLIWPLYFGGQALIATGVVRARLS